ncbi:MAG: OmpA family protein [Desulfovibrionaceae bacterium]|nr:OmpA family protein [Desulfovibrionaceae bacterium]
MNAKITGLCLAALLVGLGAPAAAPAQGQDLMRGDDIVRRLEKPAPTRGFVTRGIKIESKGAQPTAQQLAPQTQGPVAERPAVSFCLNFKYGSTDLADEQSRRQLEEIGKALSSPALSSALLEVGGHTDDMGTDAYNMDLSYQRASAIKRYLVSNYRVDPARLKVKGYGESQPVAENQSESGRAKNRRVVIKRLD